MEIGSSPEKQNEQRLDIQRKHDREVERRRFGRIFHNGTLKIASLLFAAAMWLFVTNYQDPETVLTVNNVPVKLLHVENLESSGKVCTVLDDTDTIPIVTVNAPRSVVDALETDNIAATADVDDMNADGSVPIVLMTNKYSDQVTSITGSINYVMLSVENEARETMTISLQTVGSVADDYQIGSTRLEQNLLTVRGPESEVSRLHSAGVVVDVTGASTTINTNAEIHLYDEDGRDIETDKNLTLNIDKVMARVEVLYTREVPIKVNMTGTPAKGYRLSGDVEVKPGTVRIAARKALADTVEAITIPGSEIDITGAKLNIVRTVDISQYLPTDVVLADGVDSKVRVTVEITTAEEISADTSK